MHFLVTVTGMDPLPVSATNWLTALGQAIDILEMGTSLERVACEQLPNGTVIARELGGGGRSYVVSPVDDDGDTEEFTHSQTTPFSVENLPQSVLLSNMDHVLRAPLNAILGYSDLLRDMADERGEDSVVRDLTRIHDAGSQLADVIAALVEAWRIEAGETQHQVASFEAASLLRDVADAVRPAVASAGLELAFDVPHEVAVIEWDPAILRTAVDRSLRRAIGLADRQVALRAYVSGRTLAIHVRDDGPTPDAEALQHVFTVFARTDPAGASRAASHIRLAASRAAIRSHGGKMTAAARSGTGSRISIVVPL